MKALIVEDEAPAARRLQRIMQEVAPEVEVLEVIDSVESAAKWLRHHHQPDLLFLDIQLADGLSFDIFDQVEITSPVIFTTAYDEYAIRAFQVNSIDYLLKPIEKEQLQRSIRKFQGLREQFTATTPAPAAAPATLDIQALLSSMQLNKKTYKERFLVKIGDKLVSLETSEVAYFTAEDKVVLLVTGKGQRYPVDYSLDELEQLLDPCEFFRLNRQFTVHIRSIGSIHSHFNGKLLVVLHPDATKEAMVSRERAPQFKQWLDR